MIFIWYQLIPSNETGSCDILGISCLIYRLWLSYFISITLLIHSASLTSIPIKKYQRRQDGYRIIIFTNWSFKNREKYCRVEGLSQMLKSSRLLRCGVFYIFSTFGELIKINPLAPGTCESNFKTVNFKFIMQNSSIITRCEIAHK